MSAISTLLLRLRAARLSVAPGEIREICGRGGRLCSEEPSASNAAAQFVAGLGIAHFFEGNYRAAVDNFTQARELARSDKVSTLFVQLTLRLAQCRIALAEPKDALKELCEAETILNSSARSIDRREHHRSVLYSHKADLARWCGHPEIAVRLAENCINISRLPSGSRGSDGTEPLGGAIGCVLKARAAISTGDHPRAVREAYKARTWLTIHPSSRWWSYVACFTLTEALARSGDTENAKSVFEKGRDAWTASPFHEASMNPWLSAEGHHMAGIIELHQGNLETAEELLTGVAKKWRGELRYVRCAPDLAAVMLIRKRTRAFAESREIMEEAERIISPFRELRESDLS